MSCCSRQRDCCSRTAAVAGRRSASAIASASCSAAPARATTQAQLVGTPPAPYGGSGAAAAGRAAPYQDCPGVAIREGASTLQIGTKPGPVSDNNEVRYQGTIIRNARDCTLFGGQVNARVGVEGRIIVGPAGAPPAVDVPIRVAVVQEGVQPKTVATKLYRTQVDLAGQDNVAFSFVAEDVSFPTPSPETVASYVIYIGFDPEGARAPRRRGRRARPVRVNSLADPAGRDPAKKAGSHEQRQQHSVRKRTATDARRRRPCAS